MADAHGPTLLGYETKAPETPVSHLAGVAKKAKKLGAPRDRAVDMVHGKKSFDSSGYRPDPNSVYTYNGGGGSAM